MAAWREAPGEWQHRGKHQGNGSMEGSTRGMAAWREAPGEWQHRGKHQGNGSMEGGTRGMAAYVTKCTALTAMYEVNLIASMPIE